MVTFFEKRFSNVRRLFFSVELGSGSGVLTTTLLQELHSKGNFSIAVDCNIHACEATLSTFQENGCETMGDMIQGDLLSSFHENVFDMLIFNPPYVPTSSEEVGIGDNLSAAWAGGKKGREVLDRLLLDLTRVMKKKSLILILALEENDPDDIVSILEEKGYVCGCLASRKAMNERLLIIMALRSFDDFNW